MNQNLRKDLNSPEPDLQRITREYWRWFESYFVPQTIEDYCNVCLKVVHGVPEINSLRPKGNSESEISAQNRLRNVSRAYKRDLRFKLVSLYAQPFGVPWSQTYASHLLRAVFGTAGSATLVNQAFANPKRTSKERVDFKPVINSLNSHHINTLNILYEQGCQRIDSELLEKGRALAQSRFENLKSKAAPKPTGKSSNNSTWRPTPIRPHSKGGESNSFTQLSLI